MRRTLSILAAAAVAVLAVPSSALAYIDGPGTPVRSPTQGTYNALPVQGTVTANGVTVPIIEFRLSLVTFAGNVVEATPSGLVWHYALTAVYDPGGGAQLDGMIGRFTIPLSYVISDAAGTLTYSGLSVPASFAGWNNESEPGTVTLTSGTIASFSVVYGADNATEKTEVARRHKTIDRAKTAADKANGITGLQSYLE